MTNNWLIKFLRDRRLNFNVFVNEVKLKVDNSVNSKDSQNCQVMNKSRTDSTSMNSHLNHNKDYDDMLMLKEQVKLWQEVSHLKDEIIKMKNEKIKSLEDRLTHV